MRWISFFLGFIGSMTLAIMILAIDFFTNEAIDYEGPSSLSKIIWLAGVVVCLFCSFLVFTKSEIVSIVLFILGIVLASIIITEFIHGLSLQGFAMAFSASILITISGIFDHLDNMSRK